MTFFKRFYKCILASHLIISSLFIFNFYAVFDTTSMDKAQCYALFESNNIQLCYDFHLNGPEFCPKDSLKDEENGPSATYSH